MQPTGIGKGTHMRHFTKHAAVVSLSLTILATVCTTELEAARKYPARTQYMAVMLAGKKIGHSVATFKIADGKALTNTKMVITLSRGSIAITISINSLDIETPDGKPLGFSMTMNQGPLGNIKTLGSVTGDGKCKVIANIASMKQEKTIPWPKGTLMSHGRMLLERKIGLKAGNEITSKVFDPTSLSAHTVTSKVGKKSRVDLFGRVVMLTEIQSVMEGRSGRINTTTYVNDEFIPLRSITPMMGMKLELIDCSRKVAMAPNEMLDVVSKVILASPVALSKRALAAPLAYSIKPTGQSKPSFLKGGNQTLKANSDGTIHLTVTAPPAPANAPLPYRGKDKEALEALKPSRYVQSDHKAIKALATKAVAGAKDTATAVANIEKFVNSYIKTKSLSVGYATAVEVAESREGDCTEHAVLTAAICRAAGIPSRVVTGLAYVERFREHRNVFGPHAWNEAYVGGKWIGLDSALGGFNTGHIALAHGEGISDAMFDIVNTIGNFKIVKIDTKAPGK